MMNSELKTITPPFITVADAGQSGAVAVAQAYDKPLRVAVFNLSLGIIVTFALDSAALQTAANGGGGQFQLPAGQSFTFILAPKQKLYCSAQAAGGTLAVALSELVFEEFTG